MCCPVTVTAVSAAASSADSVAVHNSVALVPAVTGLSVAAEPAVTGLSVAAEPAVAGLTVSVVPAVAGLSVSVVPAVAGLSVLVVSAVSDPAAQNEADSAVQNSARPVELLCPVADSAPEHSASEYYRISGMLVHFPYLYIRIYYISYISPPRIPV